MADIMTPGFGIVAFGQDGRPLSAQERASIMAEDAKRHQANMDRAAVDPEWAEFFMGPGAVAEPEAKPTTWAERWRSDLKKVAGLTPGTRAGKVAETVTDGAGNIISNHISSVGFIVLGVVLLALAFFLTPVGNKFIPGK